MSERVLKGLMAVCLAVLVSAAVDGFRAREAPARAVKTPLHVTDVGETAPDFSVTADNGRRFTRADFGGKVLVLNFWASWCPPCVEETPSLDQFSRTLAGSGAVVLAISVDEDEQAYRAFLKKANVTFATFRDPQARISASYGTVQFPETYIIDRSGRVVEKFIGAADWNDPALLQRMKALLAS